MTIDNRNMMDVSYRPGLLKKLGVQTMFIHQNLAVKSFFVVPQSMLIFHLETVEDQNTLNLQPVIFF